MEILIPIGSFVTVLGLFGLGYCVWLVLKAKRAGLDEAGMKAALQKAMVYNMAALGLSAIGLMMVVIGVLF
ncbi:MAG: hypothetical protein GXP03_15225 [Alphaproteobacteria bacterium]|nr:hypothetical protein [Alphaproteobacteria bacterium]